MAEDKMAQLLGFPVSENTERDPESADLFKTHDPVFQVHLFPSSFFLYSVYSCVGTEHRMHSVEFLNYFFKATEELKKLTPKSDILFHLQSPSFLPSLLGNLTFMGHLIGLLDVLEHVYQTLF